MTSKIELLRKSAPTSALIRCERLRTWSLIQIDAQIALCLALHTGIVDAANPILRNAIVRQLAVRGRRMPEIVDIEYENFVAGILDNRQTHRIGDTRCR